MIFIITGAGHAGKTLLAQWLVEKYKYSCLSIDHLKMGLIRSGQTHLTPLSDTASLTQYLWPIVAEMIKTAVENKQNLIVEGCYVPADWADSFSEEYLENIKLICIVMTENYIENHSEDIMTYANIIESRFADEVTKDWLIKENKNYLEFSEGYNCKYIVIDKEYSINIDDL